MLSSEMVRTAIFGVRNAEKTKKGHIGRAAVCLGQSKNLFDAVKELDCGLATSAQSASNVFHKACKKDALLSGFNNVATKCSKNVNPLIWASAGLDVIFADDKKEALVENAAAIGTMRLAETYMKYHLDDAVDNGFKLLKETKIANKVKDVKAIKAMSNNIKGHLNTSNSNLIKGIAKGGIPAVVKGVLFVVGSCLAYDVGKKFGDVLLGKE